MNVNSLNSSGVKNTLLFLNHEMDLLHWGKACVEKRTEETSAIWGDTKYRFLFHFQLKKKIWHLDLLNCHKFAVTAFKLIKWARRQYCKASQNKAECHSRWYRKAKWHTFCASQRKMNGNYFVIQYLSLSSPNSDMIYSSLPLQHLALDLETKSSTYQALPIC